MNEGQHIGEQVHILIGIRDSGGGFLRDTWVINQIEILITD